MPKSCRVTDCCRHGGLLAADNRKISFYKKGKFLFDQMGINGKEVGNSKPRRRNNATTTNCSSSVTCIE
ncbi:hypothetical protein scyTo_0011150 [Scyliorhinus torazame]|uniref:Uncharacterized protein n=1 Tax=Scyliorhinus torazame TaxID=75743 RepID=A0A401NI23_SCYTO|nr:hypothetical protein [Scyliorhinus torazame]